MSKKIQPAATLRSLGFDAMPSKSETRGVGRQRGIFYRCDTVEALDEDGFARKYFVRISSVGKIAIKRGLLTPTGSDARMARLESQTCPRARAFVLDFFAESPCNRHNAVHLARYLSGEAERFDGLLNWLQLPDFVSHGYSKEACGDPLPWIRSYFRKVSLSTP